MSPVAVRPLFLESEELRFGFVQRIRAQLSLKLGLYLGLSIAFCVPYFIIQRLPWLHPRTLPLNWIDQDIGYQPAAIYAYQSVYLLIPLFPFLSTTRKDLFRFARGFLLMCAVSFLVFLLFPVSGPRPEHATGNWMTQLVFSYDRNLNAFPSLHAGLAVYSVLFGFSTMQARPLVVVCAVWSVVIMLATLATKQHYFVDLPPAFLLAWVSHRWAWWRA